MHWFLKCFELSVLSLSQVCLYWHLYNVICINKTVPPMPMHLAGTMLLCSVVFYGCPLDKLSIVSAKCLSLKDREKENIECIWGVKFFSGGTSLWPHALLQDMWQLLISPSQTFSQAGLFFTQLHSLFILFQHLKVSLRNIWIWADIKQQTLGLKKKLQNVEMPKTAAPQMATWGYWQKRVNLGIDMIEPHKKCLN